MDIMKQITQFCLWITTLCVFASVITQDTVHGNPLTPKIKIWNKHIEVSARIWRVNAGSRVSLKCDAIYSNNPLLVWYGPDGYWIRDNDSRVRVEKSRSKRFLKVIIDRVQPIDAGEYICLDRAASERRFYMKSIRIVVVNAQTSPPTTTTVTTQETTTLPRPTPTPTPTPTPITLDSCAFRCSSDQVCLESTYVCDGFPDCSDGSDEDSQTCAYKKICSENMVACASGDECVAADNRCDGVPHCQDRSDEAPELCQNSTVPGF